ncbi:MULTISPECIES: hypothetical protein [unclassified Crossiella]|uniref:hypothetical protein n=1 Tax=unclassified Crossiella TaxID=2620835 RepID=UPI001FFF3D2E|nr:MULTISPECIES: hypothetical protein [unclassified Crossiella]MCK2242802.1 hypothetical protein [Crossiella sp. S99.2]MCK2256679.1 hypothetical protein [Crossiella sp. S99.1]
MADRIELRIDHLVLDGVAEPHQVTEITEAVHAELTRLLTAAPAGRWAPARRRRAVGRAVVTGRPGQLATTIAQSVHQAVRGGVE